MKSKNEPQTRTQKAHQWPLPLSAVLVLIWVALKLSLTRIPVAPQVTIFYPVYVAMNSPLWRWIIVAVLCTGVILLHRMALQRGLYRHIVMLSGLMQSGVIVFMVYLFSVSQFFILPLQTLSLNQHTYHLVLTQDRGYFEEIRRYDVLECDLSGLLCQHYATPYQREGNCFPIFASVEIEPTTQRLLLRLQYETYAVDPNREMGWSSCPITGLTR